MRALRNESPPRPALFKRSPLRSQSDFILFHKAVRRRDREALGVLADRYYTQSVRVAMRFFPEPRDAEDAAQEAWLKLLTFADTHLPRPKAFWPWFATLVLNVCRDRHRRAKSRQTHRFDEQLDASSDSDNPFYRSDIHEASDALFREIDRLSDDQKSVLLLTEFVGLSFEEVAARLEIPVGTAKSHAHRARRALQRRLSATGFLGT